MNRARGLALLDPRSTGALEPLCGKVERRWDCPRRNRARGGNQVPLEIHLLRDGTPNFGRSPPTCAGLALLL